MYIYTHIHIYIYTHMLFSIMIPSWKLKMWNFATMRPDFPRLPPFWCPGVEPAIPSGGVIARRWSKGGAERFGDSPWPRGVGALVWHISHIVEPCVILPYSLIGAIYLIFFSHELRVFFCWCWIENMLNDPLPIPICQMALPEISYGFV